MTLKLEVGKRYRNRKGEVVTVVYQDGFDQRFCAEPSNYRHLDDGRLYLQKLSDFDLIEEVIEHRFKVGDKVTVKKPSDTRGKFCWFKGMDCFDGTVQEVEGIIEAYGFITFKDDEHAWSFDPAWLKPAQEPVKKPLKWAKEAHAWIDGIEVEWESAFEGGWYRATPANNPVTSPHLNWRIAVPQWRKDLYAAIKSGKNVEFNHASGVGWVEWGEESANEFLRHDAGMYMKEEDFRIKPQEVPQWRKDLAEKMKAGGVLEHWNGATQDWRQSGYCIDELLCQDYLKSAHESSYRIRPEQKPDVVGYCEASYKDKIRFIGSVTSRKCPGDNLKLTWDGETGKLKDAEVLR